MNNKKTLEINNEVSDEDFALYFKNIDQKKIFKEVFEIVSNKKTYVNFKNTIECFNEETDKSNKFILGFGALSLLEKKKEDKDNIDPEIFNHIKKKIIEQMV